MAKSEQEKYYERKNQEDRAHDEWQRKQDAWEKEQNDKRNKELDEQE